jgi:phytoene/squalene synthetase
VDELFAQLSLVDQLRVADLVRDMALAMIESSTIFEEQGGVLDDQQQVLDYCRGVIGLPALFAMDLLLGTESDKHASDALEVSELIQLANITRDVEKDLQRGVAYHPALKPHLGSAGKDEVAVVVEGARRDLVGLAIKRVRSFRRLLNAVDLPRVSAARVAAVLMMQFTERHYRPYVLERETVGSQRPRGVATMLLTALPAAFSRRWADRMLVRAEEDLLATG